MRGLVLVLPGALMGPGETGPLRGLGGPWDRLRAEGRVVRLEGDAGLGPLSWLGIGGGEAGLAQGPLTVAALGGDAASGALQGHLSLGSMSEEGVLKSVASGSARIDEVAEAMAEARRLETRSLRFVAGPRLDHGLIWDGASDEVEAPPFLQAVGRPYRDALPQGEGEAILKRLIEDSVDVLDGLEVNARRRDLDEPPLNVLWPWGLGFRPGLPNLAMAYGPTVRVVSRSLRLLGLGRLAHLEATPVSSLGQGVFPLVERLAESAAGTSVVHVDGFRAALAAERAEEAERMLLDLGNALLVGPLTDRSGPVAVLATDGQGAEGLAILYDPERPGGGTTPFDERALEDKQGPWSTAAEVAQGVLLAPPSGPTA